MKGECFLLKDQTNLTVLSDFGISGVTLFFFSFLKQSRWISLIQISSARPGATYELLYQSRVYAHRLQPSYLRSNRKHRVPECLGLPVAPPGSSSSSDPWRRRAAGPRAHSAVSFVALWIFCSGTTPTPEHSEGVKRVSWPQAEGSNCSRSSITASTPNLSSIMPRAQLSFELYKNQFGASMQKYSSEYIYFVGITAVSSLWIFIIVFTVWHHNLKMEF